MQTQGVLSLLSLYSSRSSMQTCWSCSTFSSTITGSTSSSWHPYMGQPTPGRIHPYLICCLPAKLLLSQPICPCSSCFEIWQVFPSSCMMASLFFHWEHLRSQPPLLLLPRLLYSRHHPLSALVIPADLLNTGMQPILHPALLLLASRPHPATCFLHPFIWQPFSTRLSWLTSSPPLVTEMPVALHPPLLLFSWLHQAAVIRQLVCQPFVQTTIVHPVKFITFLSPSEGFHLHVKKFLLPLCLFSSCWTRITPMSPFLLLFIMPLLRGSWKPTSLFTGRAGCHLFIPSPLIHMAHSFLPAVPLVHHLVPIHWN